MADGRFPDRYRLAEPGEFPGFERALALVAEDVQRTWPNSDVPRLELVVFQWDDGDASILVGVSGGGSRGNAIVVSPFPDEGPGTEPVAAVADLAQETLMEGREFRVWPVCGAHSRGLHPSVADGSGDEDDIGRVGPAYWWCSATGGHRVAEVGRLGLDGR